MDPIIESYLSGKLTGAELREFESRLQADPAFREEVAQYQQLREQLYEYNLLLKIKSADRVVKERRKRRRKQVWWSAAAILLILAGAVFHFFRPKYLQPEIEKKENTLPRHNPDILPADKIPDPDTPDTIPKKIPGSPERPPDGPIAQSTPRAAAGESHLRHVEKKQPVLASDTAFHDSLFITPAYKAMSWDHPEYARLAVLIHQQKTGQAARYLPSVEKGTLPSDSVILLLGSYHLAQKNTSDATRWFFRIYDSSSPFYTEAAWGLAWCAMLDNELGPVRAHLEEVITQNDPVYSVNARQLLARLKK